MHLVSLDREAIAVEVELRPTRKVIFVLGFLRPILEVAIVDRLGPADVVDAHNQWMDTRERSLAFVDETGEYKANHSQHQDGDLQVGVHYQWIIVLFQILFRCACDFGL